MKKTFRYLSMAALLVVGTIMTGCSSDDHMDNQPRTEINNNVVTLTATISFDSNAGTRAITPSTGAKTFESTNQIAVIYKDGDSKTQKAVSTTFTPSADGTKATFTVTLNSPANNSAIRYIYPATMAKDVANDATITDDDATIDYTGLLNSQNGDLTTLGTNYDLAVYDGNLNRTNLPGSATLTNPLAICGFTLTDGGSDITNTVNSLTVSDGTNSYAITPSALSTIYVAMKPTSGNIAFAASTTAPKTYFKTATGKTLAASNLYSISVSMVELAIDYVFCSDGSVYASKDAATTAGKTPVALICYLDNDAETNTTYMHGLALALDDANGGNKAAWCSQTSDACLTTQYDNKDEAKTDIAGIANTDRLVGHASHTHDAANAARNYKYAAIADVGAHPTGTSAWFLPSAGQWDKMITAVGGSSILWTHANLKSSSLY